jgi:uncharacterized membrane protein
MEVNSDLEERLERLERIVAELSGRMSGPLAPLASRRAQPKPHTPRPQTARNQVPSRGADWWLARAGAALTVVALILLYQYAVGHGWITPTVRVATGVAIGAALMHWGSKIEPAASDADFPVALRELMMGSALAAWYVTAYAASVLYHLISVPTARFIYLLLSIAGGFMALNERRALLAIIAIGTGFATPALLPSPTASIPAYMLFLGVLGALSVYLYLMRGWQSILWIAFFSMWGSIDAAFTMLNGRPASGASVLSQSLLSSSRLSASLLVLAMTYAFLRAPVMRRKLLATGSIRYLEPIRSAFAQNWLRETAGFLKYFSPNAGALDSLSVWVIMLAAPLVGISLLSSAWNPGGYVRGILAIFAAAAAARRFYSGIEADREVNDVFCAAAIIWSLAGSISIGRGLAQFAGSDATAISLGIVAGYSMLIVIFLSSVRFLTALAAGRVLAALGIAFVVFVELSVPGNGRMQPQRSLTLAFGIAEVLAIVAAGLVTREMSRRINTTGAAVALGSSAYAALLLVDARVLGALWSPLVTATYAIAGAALLILGRSPQSRIMQRAGGATIAVVIGRLLFVDLVGVDTIWRVLLFLGCGTLFLFTSHQIQATAKQPPPDTA